MSSDGQFIITSRFFTSEQPNVLDWLHRKIRDDLRDAIDFDKIVRDQPSYIMPEFTYLRGGILFVSHDRRMLVPDANDRGQLSDIEFIHHFVVSHPILYRVYYTSEYATIDSYEELMRAIKDETLPPVDRVQLIDRSFIDSLTK